jgi:probable rRNA maturation factor
LRFLLEEITTRPPMSQSPPADDSNQVNLHIESPLVPQAGADSIKSVVLHTLQNEGVTGASLSIQVTDDETVRALNREFRNVDAPTDVLSFANLDSDTQGSDGFVVPPEMVEEMAAYLGDIVIACPYAERQAARFGNDLMAELRLLAVHGTLHLLGYDHDTRAARRDMWTVQSMVLTRFGDEDLSERTYDD